MQIGYLGLGKMGLNMVTRLLEQHVAVVAWNRSAEPREQAVGKGASSTATINELVTKLSSPRIIWLMLPAGDVTESVLKRLSNLLNENDIIIDGGNSFYQDSIRRAQLLGQKSIRFLDVGVSGGPAGARNGATLMIGGEKENFEKLHQLWQAIAAPDAYSYVGPIGAGHFAKMVHNGIEYGMMEAIAEGAAVLKHSPFDYELGEIFKLYNHQSVIASRLIGWAAEALQEDPQLAAVSSTITASGEGAWTVNEAKRLQISIPIIEQSLAVRTHSAQDKEDSPEGFRNKVVSALRGKFGGHEVRKMSNI